MASYQISDRAREDICIALRDRVNDLYRRAGECRDVPEAAQALSAEAMRLGALIDIFAPKGGSL